MTRIFYVEDDAGTAEEIGLILTSHHYEARHFACGGDLIQAVEEVRPDVLVLDRRLPDMEGLEILATLKARDISVPTLVLSALSDLNERVKGLRAGGDDYLAKPFEGIELVARIEALARRPQNDRETRLSRGPVTLDLIEKAGWRRSRSLDLLGKEFEVLQYLMRNEGNIVTRSMLLHDVWGYRFEPRSNVVDVHMGRVRRKLDAADEIPLISSVRGQGYRFVAYDG